MLHPVHTTNFIPKTNDGQCTGCGKCAAVCPISAIEMTTAEKGERRLRVAKVNDEICLGCGVCVRSCPRNAIVLTSRGERIITPVNSVHRVVLMAIEKGKLQELVFDSQAFASHRAMAAVLSAILKLPPLKRAMASKQLKSVYLDRLIGRVKY
jgi:formate hydrogenlyase subunit 6/NADH:ubiquinone oxidoreductase subunit I